jgi:hypothetical protein
MRAFLPVLSFVILLSSCRFAGFHQVRGNGVHSSQQRNVGAFTQVEASGPVDIELSQGPSSVRVDADENLQEYIEVESRGNTLYVHLRDNISVNPKAGMKVYITAPDFRSIQLTGSGDLTGQGRIRGNDLNIDITGSGSVTLDLDMPRVRAHITGSGETHLSGATRRFDSEINGSGSVAAFGLMSEETNVSIHGSGDAEVFASKHLDIDIAGSGDVAYKGTATVNKSVHGSGDIRKAD